MFLIADLGKVRDIGEGRDAVGRRHGEHLYLARIDVRHDRRERDKRAVDLAAEESDGRRAGAALVRDLDEVDAGCAHEQLHFEPAVAAGAGGAEIELTGAGLGVLDELLHGLHRHRGVDGERRGDIHHLVTATKSRTGLTLNFGKRPGLIAMVPMLPSNMV